MKKVWNEFYKNRGRYYLIPHPDFDSVIKKFKLYRMKRVLDLGCGSGRHSIALAKEGFSVTGIDFSEDALTLAKRWAHAEELDITFKKTDFKKKLPFRENSFDSVIAIDSLQYDTRTTLEFALEDSSRVIREKGLFFITLPTKVGNPLVSHLVFEETEIKQLVTKWFSIIDTFIDSSYFLCVLAIKS